MLMLFPTTLFILSLCFKGLQMLFMFTSNDAINGSKCGVIKNSFFCNQIKLFNIAKFNTENKNIMKKIMTNIICINFMGSFQIHPKSIIS
jgi:hypothetical protein